MTAAEQLSRRYMGMMGRKVGNFVLLGVLVGVDGGGILEGPGNVSAAAHPVAWWGSS